MAFVTLTDSSKDDDAAYIYCILIIVNICMSPSISHHENRPMGNSFNRM